MTPEEIISLATLITSLGAVLIGWRNSGKIHNVHIDLNSKLATLLTTTRLAGHYEGREEARKEEQERFSIEQK